jgi:hypothetical protein
LFHCYGSPWTLCLLLRSPSSWYEDFSKQQATSLSLSHLVQRQIGNSMTDLGFFRSSKSWLQTFGFEQEQKGLELIRWVHLYIISWEQFLLQDFWETSLKQGSEQACSFGLEIDSHEHWSFLWKNVLSCNKDWNWVMRIFFYLLRIVYWIFFRELVLW